MEHRYTQRKPLNISAVIACPRVGLFRGRIRDLSLGGMHVQSDCVVMPIHAPVTVSFQTDPDDPATSIEANGMVVHQRGNTFGLMFDEHDATLGDALRGLLFGLSQPLAAGL
jgi:hypothetical protein